MAKHENPVVRRAQREVDAAEAAYRLANKRLERALAVAAVAERIPKEPKKNTIIKFQVQYNENDIVYTYVAVRLEPGWYITGRSSIHTWETLVDLMQRDITSKRHDGAIRFFAYSTDSTAGKWMGRKDG